MLIILNYLLSYLQSVYNVRTKVSTSFFRHSIDDSFSYKNDSKEYAVLGKKGHSSSLYVQIKQKDDKADTDRYPNPGVFFPFLQCSACFCVVFGRRSNQFVVFYYSHMRQPSRQSKKPLVLRILIYW